jgi:hypothetical protein
MALGNLGLFLMIIYVLNRWQQVKNNPKYLIMFLLQLVLLKQNFCSASMHLIQKGFDASHSKSDLFPDQIKLLP